MPPLQSRDELINLAVAYLAGIITAWLKARLKPKRKPPTPTIKNKIEPPSNTRAP